MVFLFREDSDDKTVAGIWPYLCFFQGRNHPLTGRKTGGSLHLISCPYSAMPCNTLKMKLRMPSRCFSDSVLTICRRSSVYTIQLQASDMGYELLCLLDLFVLLDRITICSWVSYVRVSLCLILICEQNCYLQQNEPFCKDFLLT